MRVDSSKSYEKGGLVFRPSTLNFDNTFVGQANKRKVTISNADTKSISIKQFAFDNAVFTHDLKLPVTLKSGEKIEKEFIFTPTKSGKIEASATILSDEGGLKVRNYSVSGTGLVVPFHGGIAKFFLNHSGDEQGKKSFPLYFQQRRKPTQLEYKRCHPKKAENLSPNKEFLIFLIFLL